MLNWRLIPVIDLKGGHVVRGIGGRREEYQPIVSCLTSSSRPGQVAQALVQNYRPREIYLADLDSIAGETPAWPVYAEIQHTGVELWVDAGIRDMDRARKLARAGIAGIVYGLESLPGPKLLRDAIDALGPEQVIFSLDLKNGRPLGDARAWSTPEEAEGVVLQAVEQGARRIIVLDLARVGEGQGAGTLDLCRKIADRHPHLEIIAGGGVRGPDDLSEMKAAGIAGALVASALHDSRIRSADCGQKSEVRGQRSEVRTP
jgi:phosphoribosylformimino-5-aminoimidazole carboxamide ribotide isomerase